MWLELIIFLAYAIHPGIQVTIISHLSVICNKLALSGYKMVTNATVFQAIPSVLCKWLYIIKMRANSRCPKDCAICPLTGCVRVCFVRMFVPLKNMKHEVKRLALNLTLLLLLGLPEMVRAQFVYNNYGDVLAGFRKTGTYQGNYELVVNLGNITNFLTMAPGAQISLSVPSPNQLTGAFADGYQDIQWSVFSTFPVSSSWTNSLGIFPPSTIWYTLPRAQLNVQNQAPSRLLFGNQSGMSQAMAGVGQGAVTISESLVTNANNNNLLVRELVSANTSSDLTSQIGDSGNPSYGDFNNSSLGFTVENLNPDTFSAATQSDFYQSCPKSSTRPTVTYTDPITGQTTGNDYFVGYFQFNIDGTMTFTRAGGNTAPAISLVSSLNTVTNGFAPLQVVFTNVASGSITNWVWNFGDGNLITNSTGGNITNSYAASGNYTVTLIVNGPAGSSTNVLSSYIKTYPKPQIIAPSLSAGKLVFIGTNCPAGVQYRILTTTNLAQVSVNWVPVYTNTFTGVGSFGYTNSMTNAGAFYRLVSP